MSVTEKQYADLCQAAYNGADGPPPAGEKDVTTAWQKGDETPGGWQVVSQANTAQKDGNLDGGFSAVIFRKGDETVVVFKGTDFATYGDAAADVDLGVSADNPQYQAMERFLRDNSQHLGGNVTFAGHSLGGNLAMHATMTSGVDARCVTFNAPGFSDEYMKEHPEFGSMGDRITEYQNERDVVSSIGHHPGSVVVVASMAGIVGFNHDLSELAWDGDSLVRADPPIKAGRCYIVEQVAALADKLIPDGSITHKVVKGVLEIVYANPEGVRDVVKYIAIHYPAIVGAVVVAVLAIVVVVAAFEFGMWIGTKVVEFAEWLAAEATKIATSIIDAIVSVGAMIADAGAKLLATINSTIKDICAKLGDTLAAFWDKLFGHGAAVIGALSVNLDELRHLAQRLRRIQNKVASVDRRLGHLAWVIDADKKLAVASIDWAVDRGWGVAACASYLEATAARLEACERSIARSAASLKA